MALNDMWSPHDAWVRIRRWIRLQLVKRGYLKVWPNPLLRYPRNLPCWCGSGRKAKVCCLFKQPRSVPAETAAMLEKYMIHVKLANTQGVK